MMEAPDEPVLAAHDPNDPTSGLSTAEAQARLAEVGPNLIDREAGPSALGILARQFDNPMIWLLLVACAVSAAFGEVANAIGIAAVIVLNGAIGFSQELRAARSLAALRELTAPSARVRRDGRTITLAAESVVPGDVLVLEAGDVVAADAEIRRAFALETNEAALTGESLPVRKSAEGIAPEAPLAERTNAVFLGTAVTKGSAVAVVTATGMKTELGRIAGLLASAKTEKTPLEARLARLGRVLPLACIGIAAVVAVLGLARGQSWLEVLMASVSLAVAAVPEGLAAVVTIALAIGVQRMADRNVLVRKLTSVETLGCTTVICTDKTGTLTTGVMAVRDVWARDRNRALDAGAACTDAELDPEGQGIGDPTEIAILLAARERAIEREEIERTRTRIDVYPFDSDRKRMAVLRSDGVLYVKGAIESVLPLCGRGTEGATEANRDMASRGLRVLAIAVGHEETERELELVGLLGLADPPRTEVIEAIRRARAAGVRTVMITGDHALTATAIARELGLLRDGDDERAIVHARATPEDKIRIVRELKERGEIVAMTGDGVNDAPALREAHIGIAMGASGTEVARESAAMILTDDNYASIVAAIREGRAIFDNIRKTIVYLLTGNVGELVIVLAASIAGLPAPITALQILWINLATEGLPAVALGMDPPRAELLEESPRRVREPLIGRREWKMILAMGLVEAAVTLSVFLWALDARDVHTARNLAFSSFVFGSVFRAFAMRSPVKVFFETGVLSNVRLLAVVALTVLVQLAIHHVPAAQELFGIGDISLGDCALSVGIGLVPVTLMETFKLVRRALPHARGPRGGAAPPASTV